jgi:NAD(P)-dependent dehydrogenase (short-subunit alcohol dehydrogenase family)
MDNKTVVITGGSQGIGLSISKKFLNAGYTVFVGSRNAGELKPTLSDRLVHVKTDVRSEADVQQLIEKAVKESGEVSVLVNNAGYSEWRPIELIDQAFLTDILSTNLMSAFWGCKSALAVMTGGASIINISSIAGKRGSANNSAYVSSKFAMNGLTQALAKEVGPRGIRVNGICPVLVSTPGLLSALNSPNSPAKVDAIEFIERFGREQSALGRLPTGDEVAAACLFLASESASAITGQNINIDCGVFPQ